MMASPGQYGHRRWFAAALLCAGSALNPALAAGKPATHTVVMEGTKYTPASLTVKRGDIVVWINRDPFPHTVTARGSFDSKPINAGRSWKYRLRKPGEVHYFCTLHPPMKGTLKIE